MNVCFRRIFGSISALAAFGAVPAFAQGSLAEQQEECQRLRGEVASARRQLDSRERNSESYARTMDSTAAGARARGRPETKIEQYRAVMGAVRDAGGSVNDARRGYEGAREAYELQGCSTGGQSRYNYDVE